MIMEWENSSLRGRNDSLREICIMINQKESNVLPNQPL